MKHTIAVLVLLQKKSWADSNPPACANGLDPIKCVDGKKEGTEMSCKDACTAAGGSCCVFDSGYYGGSADACYGFNGSVCPDGSCSGGSGACQDANIGLVVNGCTGNYACFYAGGGGGYIGMVIDSCKNGAFNCDVAGYNGGYIGMIIDSCKNGADTCFYAGGDGGYIGMINDSCKNGDLTCYYAGSRGGFIGQLVSSCAGTPDVPADEACESAATFGSTISGMNKSCNNERACYQAGVVIVNGTYYETGIPYDIEPTLVNCCNGEEECVGITEFPDFCPKSKSGKTAKSTKSTKSGKVADEIIQADLNFQGIEFSMMAGDESLSYDQSVDVGLLSFDFSEGEGSK